MEMLEARRWLLLRSEETQSARGFAMVFFFFFRLICSLCLRYKIDFRSLYCKPSRGGT